ncbi:GGDEF domain-containing protein [Sphingosinicella rhizophila]|uniref:GGDEF domain-containing protein n=1 Tax=Sphingosinicella rhizophila TaxID=3050082 RepID=A0ABU3Q5H3_9SPHN|nr:GGDEF domain-containing protein [Sphingosinicella sp. GR2756]MDT9598655.1 GGDEF domain-containing protein [Sphingosinicella sp. GR2756]
MGAFCAIIVVTVAFLRTTDPIYGVLIGFELVLVTLRLLEWRLHEARLRLHPADDPAVDASVLLSFLWCALQGASAFIIMSGDDPVLRILSATLVMALIGPICARNYAAPRFAFMLILLCDLPFVAGAIASREPWLVTIAAITPPFLFGAMQIITTFHRTMLLTLAAEAKNLHLAQHDSLTGILNRHGMDAALGQLVPRHDKKMALISIDLDGFKQVNDSLGHGAGDLLLIQVAERIRGATSDDALIGRMGGDEFMVVLRDTSPDQVTPIVEDLITTISHQPYELSGGTTARVGASIGFACLPEDAGSTVELRLRADQALYAAKERGKGVGLRYGEREDGTDRSLSSAGEMKAPFVHFDRWRSR